MKRKILAFILALVLFGAAIVSVSASAPSLMWDNAGLLTESQVSALNQKLEAYRDSLGFEIAVITVTDMQGYDASTFTNAIYDSYDYGYGMNKDGALLMISMADRDYYITGVGIGAEYVNNSAIKVISNMIVPNLSTGNYYEAFDLYADMVAQFVTNGMNGNVYKEPFHAVKVILIGLAVSLVVGLAVVGGFKSELKSVRVKSAAADYVEKGSLNVTESREQFLYHQVTRTARPKNTGSRGGGGGGRSGGGGKF